MNDKQKYKFLNLEEFKDVDDIPDIPGCTKEELDNIIIPSLYRCGAIPKKDLIIGETYLGSCRNSYEAKWNGTYFLIKRNKFGTYYNDKINHFEDDDGFDLFIPIKIKNK